MVTIKTDDEIELMRRSCRLAAEVLLMIEPYVKPGLTTDELNDRCHDYILENGAIPAPLDYRGFPKSICASVNDEICHGIPSDRKLRNGDMVEVVTSKTQRPSPDWLEIVATSRARNKVRSYLRAEERKQSRQVGQDLLEKGLRRFGCSFGKMLKQGEIDRVAGELRLGKADDLIAALGYGKVDKDDVIDRLLPEEKKKKPLPNLQVIRILDDIPPLVGLDAETYHLKKEDVVTLDPKIAEILINKNLAVEIEIKE